MPLTPYDSLCEFGARPAGPITFVFCTVEGGRQYNARHKLDARLVGLELKALMLSILRQVWIRWTRSTPSTMMCMQLCILEHPPVFYCNYPTYSICIVHISPCYTLAYLVGVLQSPLLFLSHHS